MANVNAPFGFVPLRRLDGAAWNATIIPAAIAYNDSTAIFKGDVVSNLNTGFINKTTPGTGVIRGIFWGCRYQSTATGGPIYSPYWPGSGAVAGTVDAIVIDDPMVIFKVQATTGPITFADIGAGVQFTAGTGNTVTGLSTASIDDVGTPTTTTLPFRVYGLATSPGNGSDHASAYNHVEVVLNNQFWKQLAGL